MISVQIEDKPKDGVLYLCGTPIGNLEDITLRALRILQEADLIAAEDTRYTRKLLNFYDIHTSVTSYHEHNKMTKGPKLIAELKEGKNIALVSDAGMPGISDPGEHLTSLAIAEDLNVVPIPGPSAVVTALVSSGLSSEKFVFEGFFPRLKKDRIKFLERLVPEQRTIVFYESPHRINKTLREILTAAGDRRVVVGRELTKVHEEFVRGNLSHVIEIFQHKQPRGEFTVVLEGNNHGLAEEICDSEIDVYGFVKSLLEEGLDKKEAIKKTARTLKKSKKEVYNAVLAAENKK